jgi:transcriptional regulator with XRE-family HTH domain
MTSVSEIVRSLHRRSGLGLRELARRAGTSHATLRAYEIGTKEPRVDTMGRLAGAVGFDLELTLVPRPFDDAAARSRELEAVLDLAAAFPARHHRRLRAPVFGR